MVNDGMCVRYVLLNNNVKPASAARVKICVVCLLYSPNTNMAAVFHWFSQYSLLTHSVKEKNVKQNLFNAIHNKWGLGEAAGGKTPMFIEGRYLSSKLPAAYYEQQNENHMSQWDILMGCLPPDTGVSMNASGGRPCCCLFDPLNK